MASLHILKNTTDTQMLGMVIKTDRHTVVIDGGTVGDAAQLLPYLSRGGRLHADAWFFTHPHHDHIGAFYALCEAHPDLTVSAIYHNFPSVDTLHRYAREGERGTELWARIFHLFSTRFAAVCHTPRELWHTTLDDLTLTVVRTYNPSVTEDLINNSSMVLRVDGRRHSLLVLGDLGEAGGDDVLRRFPVELLRTDYTQMAHHGQNGVRRSFYERIRPRICLWPCPLWLWNNDLGRGFDTAQYATVRTREWMEALGARAHVVAGEGTRTLVL